MTSTEPTEVDGTGLAGVAEISEYLKVPRTTVSMWAARRETSGFPLPIERLYMGPVYQMDEVVRWHREKYNEE
jgi:hypothetical protein